MPEHLARVLRDTWQQILIVINLFPVGAISLFPSEIKTHTHTFHLSQPTAYKGQAQ